MEKFYLIRTDLRLDGEELEVTTHFAHTREKAQEVAELEIGDYEHNFRDNDMMGEEEDTDTTAYREDCYGNTIFVEIKEITEEDFEK